MEVTQLQPLAESMNRTLKSLCAQSQPANDAERDRLEDAFRDYCRRCREVHHWTPELLVTRWSWFAKECATLWQASGVPRKFTPIDLLRLDKWLPQKYHAMAKVLLQLRDKPQLIAVGGPRGCGKTGMACGLVRAFCRMGRPALYARVRDFFDAIDGVPWEQKTAVKEQYAAPNLLVLDEVQVRDAGKAWQDNDLTTLIDRRYSEERCTVLLSNLQPEALVKNLGDSVQRRLMEQGQILETDWPQLEPMRAAFDEKVAKAMSI